MGKAIARKKTYKSKITKKKKVKRRKMTVKKTFLIASWSLSLETHQHFKASTSMLQIHLTLLLQQELAKQTKRHKIRLRKRMRS